MNSEALEILLAVQKDVVEICERLKRAETCINSLPCMAEENETVVPILPKTCPAVGNERSRRTRGPSILASRRR